MITPIEIQEKEFTKAVRGYKEEEVNEFLDEITIDMDRLLNELRETREENSRLTLELERIRSTEGTVVETLQAAKDLMSEIAASSEKRASILIKNAELDAEMVRKTARDEAEVLAKENRELKQRDLEFRNRYKALLEAELQRFESSIGDALPELGVVDFDDLPIGEDEKPIVPIKTTDTIQTNAL